MTRREFLTIKNIPKVKRSETLEYISTGQQAYDKGFENNILPLLSDLTIMNVNLESSKNVGVVFNKQYFFDRADVVFSKRIHDIISIKDEIKNDINWFKQAKRNLKFPDGFDFQHLSSLDTFKKILLDH